MFDGIDIMWGGLDSERLEWAVGGVNDFTILPFFLELTLNAHAERINSAYQVQWGGGLDDTFEQKG